MKKRATPPIFLLAICLLLLPAPASATDVDGPDDCVRPLEDFGDAPEGVQAYLGVIGCFPTCLAPGPIGTQQFLCGTPSGPPPGPAGYVRHVQTPGASYWLGCLSGSPPLGIDSEIDGKTNDLGQPFSACSQIPVDCYEAAFGLNFGQDECYGSNDAAIGSPVVFQPCTMSWVGYRTYSCAQTVLQVYLNVLVDWNQDGDWNDAIPCPGGGCAYEWAVQNFAMNLMPGCVGSGTPQFLSGPNPGRGWMRITISDTPVPPDFPWNGTVSAGGAVRGGETEDYPVTIAGQPSSCPEYLDFGDAPEDDIAYPSGVQGRFPTCIYPGPPGTQEVAAGCLVASPPPAMTGHVLHRQNLGDPVGFWLGCWQPFGVDNEPDGKTNATGAPASRCNPTVLVDCAEAAFGGMSFGQDECTGDGVDAGVPQPLLFQACQNASVTFDAFNCEPVAHAVVLNILVDWNEDGDWNDVVLCPGGQCVPEWAVQNVSLMLNPGCQTLQSPAFLTGPRGGFGWLRITLTETAVPPDFPWNGSLSMASGEFEHGETEDYPVVIEGLPDPCPEYRDAGDAPEDAQAYPGVPGRFPTCVNPSPPGTQELAAGCQPISIPPGPTGFVQHRRGLGSPLAFWLGCWQPGVDDEGDGKTNDNGAPSSWCNPSVPIDCVEPAWLPFGQDERYGDATDAGIQAPVRFTVCQPGTVTFDAMNCGPPAEVFLNILVDWNRDGDWNDVFLCPSGTCAYEWAVKNVVIILPSGCTTLTSPVFLAGPNPGEGWLRITLSERPAPDDFPWNGTLGMPLPAFAAGETEDYPILIDQPPDPCPEYHDFGDAPEDARAYPGVPGRFPTCMNPSLPGTQELAPNCPAISTAPGPTGFATHRRPLGSPYAFWLGCWNPGVDSDPDGKTNDTGGAGSACSPATLVDCVEAAFGLSFGQDECTADGVDAGIRAAMQFVTCQPATVTFDAMNCGPPMDVYLNVLVDWNQDGDWNDNFRCPTTGCAYEWAVKNVLITLPSGCTTQTSPVFLVGPNPGDGWLRVTLSEQPAPDDFPWNGTAGMPASAFEAGETEDYPVTVVRGDPCEEPYEDYGDAPEHFQAYPGVPGRFPTCLFAGLAGTMEIQCGTPTGIPPGPTGFVRHVSGPQLPWRFWLGCPDPVSGYPGVDTEVDGKSNDNGSPMSLCSPNQPVDCLEPLWLPFGQDECTGDLDAGVTLAYRFPQCTLQQVQFRAYDCGPPIEAFLNVLVDWNRDGDWNDNILCPYTNFCAPEWAVVNAPVILQPGCAAYVTPPFRVGPNRGPGWMRITLSQHPAPGDFPWNGTVSLPGQQFEGGETEDYPVEIVDSPIGATDQPLNLALAPAVPNPARGTTTLRFSVPVEQEVTLAAYDIHGRQVRALRSGTHSAGVYNVAWDFTSDGGSRLPAGVYLVKLTADDQVFTQRVIRVR
jgi:hypothetical protein